MRNLFFVVCSLLCGLMSYSQVSSLYSFSETTGTYTSITGGTQLVTTTGGATTYDTDGSYFTLPAGSQFTYNSVTITSINMTSDGAIYLNPLTTTTGNGTTGPISSTGTAAGVISAMGMDLRSTALASQVYERRWQDVGTEVVFQWQNAARFGQSTVERFSFQIRVNETTGEIKVVYGNMTTIANSTTYQPQVGLRGSTNADFNNRRLTGTVPDATPNWGAPNGTTGGNANGNTVRFTSNSSCFPASGLTFIWTIQSCLGPTSPTIAFTSPTSANLSWTAPASPPGSGYSWEIRTSGAGGSGATGLVASGTTAAGVTSTSTSSLTALTTYILYVQSNCGATTSAWVASSSSTSPPSNNDCSGSTSVSVNSGSTCTVTSSGTTNAATQSQAGCVGTADDDVWYSFIATNTSHIVTITPGTLADAVFQVFSGTCSGLTSLVCVDNTAGSSVETTTVSGLTVGVTYYVRVHSYAATNGSKGTFTVCITTPCTIPTTAGTLSADKYSTVVNDAVTFSITGNGGSVTLFEWSYNNFTTVAGSTSNPVMPYTLQLNVYQTQIWFRATSTSGSCPSGVTSPILVNLELAPPYTSGVGDGDYISNVTFSDINNTSTDDGDAYSDYLSIIGNVDAGGSYTISVSGTFTFGSYSGYAAWIDWDQDGVFQTSENILISAPMATGTAIVNVPSSSVGGTAKMRVLSVWNGTPVNDPYYSTGYGYGEIEEYTIQFSVPLPIELLYFTGTGYSMFNVLKWSTASEHNSDYFSIKRSKDGIDWKEVGQKKSAGNSSTQINYSFIDSYLNDGIVYYKLLQVDYDGKSKEYGPISIIYNITVKKVVKYVNLLGQEVLPDTPGLLFEVYEDGSMSKIIR